MSIHDNSAYAWLGIGRIKITFSDELNFDLAKIDAVYNA